MKSSDLVTLQNLPDSETESIGTSLSSYSLSHEKYYNTNMNKQLFGSRSKRLSSFNNTTAIPTKGTPIVNLRGLRKRHPPIPLDDFYVQQEMALRQSLRSCKMASCGAAMRPSRVGFGTKENGEQESRESTKPTRETTPKISLSTAPAHIPHLGQAYPLPSYPTPRYFIERHRNTKTGWEHPYKSDLTFRFTRKLHKPNLRAHHTMLGPIDASNEIIKQHRKEEKRQERVRDLC